MSRYCRFNIKILTIKLTYNTWSQSYSLIIAVRWIQNKRYTNHFNTFSRNSLNLICSFLFDREIFIYLETLKKLHKLNVYNKYIFIKTVHILVEFTQQVLFCVKNKYTNSIVTIAYVCLLFVHLLKIIGFSKLVGWEWKA